MRGKDLFRTYNTYTPIQLTQIALTLMQFFLKTFLLCLALMINQEIWAQNIYQKVDIPVGNSFTQEELEDNIRKQYPFLGNSELQLTHEIQKLEPSTPSLFLQDNH